MQYKSNAQFFTNNPPVSAEYLKRLEYLDGQIKALREYKPRARNKSQIARLLWSIETVQARAIEKLNRIGELKP